MPASPCTPCIKNTGQLLPHPPQHPRSSSETDAECIRNRQKDQSNKSNKTIAIFRSLKSTPNRFTGALCPINLQEQKEQFLQHGIVPQFILKNSDTLDKLNSKDRGEIRFTYLNEAKEIIDAVKNKYGDGSVFLQEMFGKRIEETLANEVLHDYLYENKLQGKMNVFWTPDLSCTAKMMWHGPCQRYNKPEARKYTLIMKSTSENNFLRDVGIVCLANHEIGTHYFRMVNEGLQPWFSDRARFQLKEMSCREFTSSEEGLATVNTVLQARSKFLWTSALLYYTACMAVDMTFMELFDHLGKYMADKEQRWKHVMRVKRSLKDTSQLGGYGQDQCYFEGAVQILRNIQNTDFNLLYSGRVCLDELPRVKRLARMDCIKLPHFLQDVEQYKRTLRQIAIVNGLIPKPKRTKGILNKLPPETKLVDNIYSKLTEELFLKEAGSVCKKGQSTKKQNSDTGSNKPVSRTNSVTNSSSKQTYRKLQSAYTKSDTVACYQNRPWVGMQRSINLKEKTLDVSQSADATTRNRMKYFQTCTVKKNGRLLVRPRSMPQRLPVRKTKQT